MRRLRMLCLPVLLSGCHPAARLPAAASQPFCTRTLGTADCYALPALLPDHPAGIADTPVRPTPPPEAWWNKIADHWQD